MARAGEFGITFFVVLGSGGGGAASSSSSSEKREYRMDAENQSEFLAWKKGLMAWTDVA